METGLAKCKLTASLMWALGSKSLGAVSIGGGGVGVCQHLRLLSIQVDLGSSALPYKASVVSVLVHLPDVLLDVILHAQSFRLLVVTWTNTQCAKYLARN